MTSSQSSNVPTFWFVAVYSRHTKEEYHIHRRDYQNEASAKIHGQNGIYQKRGNFSMDLQTYKPRYQTRVRQLDAISTAVYCHDSVSKVGPTANFALA